MYAKKNSGIKVVATLLAIVLLMACGIGGTIAWLAAKSETVTNTFTAGNITIELKEHELVDGKLTEDEVTENDTYKVVPGGTQPKDPFVRVQGGSEKCYVYALVENNMKIDGTVVVTPNINSTQWDIVTSADNKTLYRYYIIVDASTSDVTCQVFTEVSYDGEKITEDTIDDLVNNYITIDAFAHQSDNTTVDVADAAAKAHFGLS